MKEFGSLGSFKDYFDMIRIEGVYGVEVREKVEGIKVGENIRRVLFIY